MSLKRVASFTSASLLADGLIMQPAIANAVEETNLPAGIKEVPTANYGFMDIVGNPFDPETNSASWSLSLREPYSASEPYVYTSRMRMVIPKQVGDYTVGEPVLDEYVGRAISQLPRFEGTEWVSTSAEAWLNQLSELRRALLNMDDATLAQEMDARLSQHPEWSIFLGSDQAWSNDTTYGTQAINPSGNWTRLEAHTHTSTPSPTAQSCCAMTKATSSACSAPSNQPTATQPSTTKKSPPNT